MLCWPPPAAPPPARPGTTSTVAGARPVERAIAWLVARGGRRVPYRLRNNGSLATRAAALNLRRLINLGLTRTPNVTWALA
jgi:hypothetical protein